MEAVKGGRWAVSREWTERGSGFPAVPASLGAGRHHWGHTDYRRLWHTFRRQQPEHRLRVQPGGGEVERKALPRLWDSGEGR